MKKISNNKELLFEMFHKLNPNSKSNKEIINEGYAIGSDDFKFVQRLNNATFIGADSISSDYDVDVTQSDIVVKWNITFWANQGGIENMIINVDSIEGNYILQQYDKQTDELMFESTKNINDIKWKLSTNEASIAVNGSLYVDGLSFDFANSTCTIEF